MEPEPRALEALRKGAAASGWRWREVSAPGKADGILEVMGQRYAVELKAATSSRGPVLEALLADSALRARVHARHVRDAEPLPVVFAPRLSAAMCQQLRKYADAYLPDIAWGAFDLEGAWCFPALEQWRLPPKRRRGAGASPLARAGSPDPFSNLGQWLAKVLLAQKVPEAWLSAPRRDASSLRELAQQAEVSLHSTQRWVAAVRKLGFLVDDPDSPLQLMRRKEFLQHWASAAMIGKPQEMRVRSMSAVPPAESVHGLAAKHPQRFTLGLHSACKALGVGIVSGALEHLYFHDPDRRPLNLGALGLVPAPEGGPGSFVIRRPIAPQSLIRGRVPRGQLWCADILQCYVDLAEYPVRGEEQAVEILRRLEWRE